MMATLGFLRRDFEVFAIKDVDARLAKIDELVTPRLMVLTSASSIEQEEGEADFLAERRCLGESVSWQTMMRKGTGSILDE